MTFKTLEFKQKYHYDTREIGPRSRIISQVAYGITWIAAEANRWLASANGQYWAMNDDGMSPRQFEKYMIDKSDLLSEADFLVQSGLEKQVLSLVLAEPWYSLMEEGAKLVEFREAKPYWAKRITGKYGFRIFDEIVFYHGYKKDRRSFRANHLATAEVDRPDIEAYFESVGIKAKPPTFQAEQLYAISIGPILKGFEYYPQNVSFELSSLG